jgi:outer membrane protein
LKPAIAVLSAGLLAASLGMPEFASALSLPEAITLAERTNPTLAQSNDQADAAAARLAQARAGRLPSLTATGESGAGSLDLGGFFGFHRSGVSPRAAALELRQPLFAGGGIGAAIDRAREGRDAALLQAAGAKALLTAQVADAYVGVLSAEEIVRLNQTQTREMEAIAGQAELKFKDGEAPRTDLAQADARLAAAQADLARAGGELARARARFAGLVGTEPDALEPLAAPPATPASLDDAVSQAARSSPSILAARAKLRAAEAGVRFADADRLPTLALVASASSARDQFFPGYRADGMAVGVQGHWTLFAGGAINAKVDEARADARAADAGLDAASASVKEAVIEAWEDVEVSCALVKAAADQTTAASSALDSVRNEVRVGQKPTLDLLDAEREALAAETALISARGQAVAAAYRLDALLAPPG